MRLARLGGGYTERHRWPEARRRFGNALEGADSRYGKEGVKYCLANFFLDVVRHGSSTDRRPGRLQAHPDHARMTPQDAARLEMLLAVQENFPAYLNVAEELASELKEREEDVKGLLGDGAVSQLAT